MSIINPCYNRLYKGGFILAKVSFYQDDKLLKEVTIKNGHSILRAAKQGRVPLKHRCGGNAQCTTCMVTIKNQQGVTDMSELEEDLVGFNGKNQGKRLGCQTRVLTEAKVIMPGDPYKEKIKQLLAEQKTGL